MTRIGFLCIESLMFLVGSFIITIGEFEFIEARPVRWLDMEECKKIIHFSIYRFEPSIQLDFGV